MTSLQDQEDRTPRIRVLTEGGKDLYQSMLEKHRKKIDETEKLVQLCIETITPHQDPETVIRSHKSLNLAYCKYSLSVEDYLRFLKNTSTEDSLQKCEEFKLECKNFKEIVEKVLQQVNVTEHSNVNVKLETKSENGTVSSTSSSVLLKKRALAEASQAKLKVAMKQVELLKKKAELDADIELLNYEKEAAAAAAEVDALMQGENGSVRSNISLRETVLERTKQYVAEQQPLHNTVFANLHVDNDNNTPHGSHVNCTEEKFVKPSDLPNCGPTPRPLKPVYNVPSVSIYDTNVRQFNQEDHALNPTALPFQSNVIANQNVTSDLTRFLLKKELMLTRLTLYNDKPEMYAVWKASFKSVVNELSVTAVEELDLLIKWLGPESKRHAQSIRASNIHNPERGLICIWERLDERYGSPESVEAALMAKLNNFPKLSPKDSKRLYELSDILSEIESVKDDPKYRSLLAYFDSSSGVLPVVNKLPFNLQEKWTTRAFQYKRERNVPFPPFTFFVRFIKEMSQVRNDPSFAYEHTTRQGYISATVKSPGNKTTVSARKTEVSTVNDLDLQNFCLVHKTKHSLNQCRAFRAKPLHIRKKFINDHKICYRCCESTKHIKRNCEKRIKCDECGSDRHPTALHLNIRSYESVKGSVNQPAHGGEESSTTEVVGSMCTEVCGVSSQFVGKSCAKILPVKVFLHGQPENIFKTYAVLDDQSNRSLASPLFFDTFHVVGTSEEYVLSSCSGRAKMIGRQASGFIVESLNDGVQLELPMLIECSGLPHNMEEIPTPAIASKHSHLREMTRHLSPLDLDCEITLLIGRDMIDAHHVLEQVTGPRNAPFAQRLPLGWVVIGDMCLDGIHACYDVSTYRTHVTPSGRASVVQPCPNSFEIRECFSCGSLGYGPLFNDKTNVTDKVFSRTIEDDKPGLSIEDRQFLSLMETKLSKDIRGNWCAPLPFRTPRRNLPNNRTMAVQRAKSLERSLRKDPVKREHIFTFMRKLLEAKHAEVAPVLKENEECWYLPVFGIYHSKKPDQIRCVFDSSANYSGISLNSVLLRGPDLTNNLVGILMRFRKERIGITADIQQMFYSFTVSEEHRNFLRFFWYCDNDIEKPLIEYRMRAHVFGNSPSPAVATYALRKTAEIAKSTYGEDVTNFVCRNFYVDDALTSVCSSDEAIDLLTRTKQALKTCGNLRLHKFASNSSDVRAALPPEDLAKNLEKLDVDTDNIPLQRSLGLLWDLESDSFTFRVSDEKKAFTRRGVLSTINSIFDPLGFVSPVTVQGKIILRKLMAESVDWDEPLTEEFKLEWETWRSSLTQLANFEISRMYVPTSLHTASRVELHTFADASESAIAAVSYLRVFHTDGTSNLGFVLGKTKVAPLNGNTIPRLELCAAVMATEISEFVLDNLDYKIDSMEFYTDSKVVLGYITNSTRRFYTYVANRVQRIRKSASPEQWNFIPTHFNPADQATRGISAEKISNNIWIIGPEEFISKRDLICDLEAPFPLVDQNNDKELRPIQNVQVLKTQVFKGSSLGTHRFTSFSEWRRLVEAIALLKRCAKYRRSGSLNMRSVDAFQEAELFVIKQVQREVYETEILHLQQGLRLPKDSSLVSLDPFLDSRGVLCVGGRLSKANIDLREKHPVIIPGTHHIAILLVRYYHQQVKHQGRLITGGAIRTAGYWITGSKRLVSSLIYKCVMCRKLRGKFQHQKMADLPKDRLIPGPPFTYVGIDCFGPWEITTRKTRGGAVNSKRWAVLFTCLTTRAIHIEVVETMTSSSFINAFKRFTAIRGEVKQIRSDRGSNFIGATDDLRIDAINVENGEVKEHLYKSGVTWIFNTPHSSHMGGVWERMIGTTRRILDSILQDTVKGGLTHEILVTLLAEVTAIVNSRPLTEISTDPEDPFPLSPSMLLTQKPNSVTTNEITLDLKDLYRAQWKRVQVLAEMFWQKWRIEFLQLLQKRRKWLSDQREIAVGDIVLLKDSSAHRCSWPLGIVTQTFPSHDDKIRKASVRVVRRDGEKVTYVRPVTEMVLLLEIK